MPRRSKNKALAPIPSEANFALTTWHGVHAASWRQCSHTMRLSLLPLKSLHTEKACAPAICGGMLMSTRKKDNTHEHTQHKKPEQGAPNTGCTGSDWLGGCWAAWGLESSSSAMRLHRQYHPTPGDGSLIISTDHSAVCSARSQSGRASTSSLLCGVAPAAHHQSRPHPAILSAQKRKAPPHSSKGCLVADRPPKTVLLPCHPVAPLLLNARIASAPPSSSLHPNTRE